MTILLVEDDVSLTEFIQKGLRAEGMTVHVAYDGFIGKLMVGERPYDLVILDVNLPGLNGYELCRYIKEAHPSLPVLMLTALGSLDHKVVGFEAGADDYLPKPFEFRELVLRLKALARRRQMMQAPQTGILKLADLEIDTDAKKVSRAGQLITLTAREYALLEYFMRHTGRVVSRMDILQHVWDLNFDTNTNIVDVYVNYLRRKIDKNFTPKLLHTVIGMGYQLREDA